MATSPRRLREDSSPPYHNVAVLPDGFQSEWNLPMSPVLAEGETRIVLTWNEYPEDLDSHLVGSDFHVYYSDQNSYDSLGRHRVNLDLDDTYYEMVTVTPRNYPFHYRKMGAVLQHYAMIGIACIVDDYPLYYDAVNERGLGMAGVEFCGGMHSTGKQYREKTCSNF